MDISEFYDYVNNKNFLNGDFIAINNDEKYIRLNEKIKSQKQIDYNERKKRESRNKEEALQQNIEKIKDFAESGSMPDIINFNEKKINKEETFNNIIYYDSNIEKHKVEKL